MATLHLPSALTLHTGGVDEIDIDASRVDELFRELFNRYPTLRTDPSLGQMVIAVDGDIHHDADYVPLRPTSEVHLVPRIAGG